MKLATIRVQWDNNDLGPYWFNEDTLKTCLFSTTYTDPDLLHIVEYKEEESEINEFEGIKTGEKYILGISQTGLRFQQIDLLYRLKEYNGEIGYVVEYSGKQWLSFGNSAFELSEIPSIWLFATDLK